MPILHIEMRF